MKIRLSIIENFFSCSSERINSSDYENAGKILQNFFRIFKLTNKHFRIKFLYIVGKCLLFISEEFFYKLAIFYLVKAYIGFLTNAFRLVNDLNLVTSLVSPRYISLRIGELD
jgi:hypothetical protein